MIRCLCPTCRAVLEYPDDKAGQKVHCPKCTERLLVPSPVRVQNHTVLGQLLTTSPNPKPAIQPPTRQVPIGDCPGFHKPLSVEQDQIGQWIECPHCRKGFAAMNPLAPHAPSSRPAPRSEPEGTNVKPWTVIGVLLWTANICLLVWLSRHPRINDVGVVVVTLAWPICIIIFLVWLVKWAWVNGPRDRG
jgi:DNA-directed RNA polymerase subunit RPC12/RpoP